MPHFSPYKPLRNTNYETNSGGGGHELRIRVETRADRRQHDSRGYFAVLDRQIAACRNESGKRPDWRESCAVDSLVLDSIIPLVIRSDLERVAATGQETPRCPERCYRSMCGTKVLKQKSPTI